MLERINCSSVNRTSVYYECKPKEKLLWEGKAAVLQKEPEVVQVGPRQSKAEHPLKLERMEGLPFSWWLPSCACLGWVAFVMLTGSVVAICFGTEREEDIKIDDPKRIQKA